MPSTTIKDVARDAGVSIATVSYVINNGPRPVSPDTRQKVLASMERLGFEPNVSARRLRRQHNNVMGLAVAGLSGRPGIADLYFLDILRGISVAADRVGYDLVVYSNHHKLETEDFFRSLARKRIVDGLIASGGAVNPQGLELLPGVGLPVVAVGRLQPVQGLTRIEFDYQADACRLTQALIQRGHRRIGLLLNSLIFPSEQRRLAGYHQALAEAGLPSDPSLIYIPGQIEFNPPASAVLQLIQQAGATTLITAPYNEVCSYLDGLGPAYRQVEAATLDYDDSVPLPASLHLGIRLAKYEAGELAVDLLLQLINGGKELPEVTTLPSRLEIFGLQS
jgi:LacI family transcriptional regulator